MTELSLYRVHSNMVAKWALVCALPLLLAAELGQRSNSFTHLPDQDAYRSNLSGRTFESSTWRQPAPERNYWRAPASPQTHWRTDTSQKNSRSVERQDVDLYPGYGVGGESSTMDFSLREDQRSGIKIFGF